MRAITLSLPTLGSRSFGLRALDGQGELQVEADDPNSSARLLAALLREPDGSPVDLGSLITTWRDRALAEIYHTTIGENVECRSTCSKCGESFEFDFALATILAQQDTVARASDMSLGEDGYWQLGGDAKLRPPTLDDIASASDPDALAQSLVAEGNPSRKAIDETLERAAPLLAFELEATCPECEASLRVGFEIARFLVQSLAAERAFLIRETHLIASRYGWDHTTIMALPRTDRQAYAGLIESERSAALARRA